MMVSRRVRAHNCRAKLGCHWTFRRTLAAELNGRRPPTPEDDGVYPLSPPGG